MTAASTVGALALEGKLIDRARGYAGVVHVARPRRPLLPDGRLSFHDGPVCGTYGLSWRPRRTLDRDRAAGCRRCAAVLQRERVAALAELVAVGRDPAVKARYLELLSSWIGSTEGALRTALFTLGLVSDGEVRTAFAARAVELGERDGTHKLSPALLVRVWSKADRGYIWVPRDQERVSA